MAFHVTVEVPQLTHFQWAVAEVEGPGCDWQKLEKLALATLDGEGQCRSAAGSLSHLLQ